MRARFLLGPSGSGKSWRCVAGARRGLAVAEGEPLLYLTPRQSTYQVERQILDEGGVEGFSRLQILSFDRLAEFLLSEFGAGTPRLLREEGRVMVLRSLLARHREDLELFRASARLRGFARQASDTLRELQRAGMTPSRLDDLAARCGGLGKTDAKLRDLARLSRAYAAWLGHQQLRDADALPGLAAEVLRASGSGARFGALWLDGFAEFSQPELDLLTRLVPRCREATLAFNLDRALNEERPWLSAWATVHRTVRALLDRLSAQQGVEISVEWLDRETPHHRLARAPALRHLERAWDAEAGSPRDLPLAEAAPEPGGQLCLLQCDRPEAEVIAAAREILRFVQSGGRFREAAVLVRGLPRFLAPIQRVFQACGLPFFLDRRAPAGHHALVELLRSALRTVAHGWLAEDWFAALKTGLVHDDPPAIDQLENLALARGWTGRHWLEPLRSAEQPEAAARAEAIRRCVIPPFAVLARQLSVPLAGPAFAQACREFLEGSGAARRVAAWAADTEDPMPGAVWEAMQNWLDDLTLAFAGHPLPTLEWIPVIEAGLASLTVGLIPPTLDQVIVGEVGRSRQAEIRLAVVLGLNESVFPAPPPRPTLLTLMDRERLANAGVKLEASLWDALGTEQYLGYIAFTRARERVVATFSTRDDDGHPLNPSPFIARLKRMFPGLEVQDAQTTRPESEREGGTAPDLHAWFEDVQRAWLSQRAMRHGDDMPLFLDRLGNSPSVDESLSPRLAAALYGAELATSVSRLEAFGECPFRFFIHSGLRLEDREQRELGAKEQGSFLHELLARWHTSLANEGRRWREATVAEAHDRLERFAAELGRDFREGLLGADGRGGFTRRMMTRRARDLVEVTLGWLEQNEFDPVAAEWCFGQPDDPLPAWRLALDAHHCLSLRGKIDRVDLWRDPETGEGRFLIVDYKLNGRTLDPALMAVGIQLQLAAYAAALRANPVAAAQLGVCRLEPAGVFYVNLSGTAKPADSRATATAERAQSFRTAFQHTGRFDAACLPQLDRRGADRGDQFKYTRRKDGTLNARSKEALPAEEFLGMIDAVERQLVEMGRAIYGGIARVDPRKTGSRCSCDFCDYASICRIDPWRHAYRTLRAPEHPEAELD